MSKKKIRLFEKKENCCGCGTCMLVCPRQAIKMTESELGCLYPVIDHEQCVGCEKCKQVCAYQNVTDKEIEEIPTMAAMAEDFKLLSNSASGGVFAVIAENILEQGGVVYGCSLECENKKLVPRHIEIEKKEELYKLQGSKYVQSFLGDIFQSVKEKTEKKIPVLFSGTPCQIDALTRYLEKEDMSSLYTIDIICHGVPSAKLFGEYLETIEKKKHRRISEFYFRDKTWGWGLNGKYILIDANGKAEVENFPADISSYYSFFLESEIYRQSCYSCKYATSSRRGDITIGDYWCLEKEHPEYTKEKGGVLSVADGVSCVLVNTMQGEKLVTSFSKGLRYEKSEFSKVAKWNRQLIGPSKHTEKRNEILTAYEKYGYKGIERLYQRKLGIKYYIRLLRNRRKQCRKSKGANIF